MRPVNLPRAGKCGHCRVSQAVAVTMREGRARFSGLVRCGLVWVCPVCSATIKAERANEVRKLYEWHKANGGNVLMLSLTVRHALGDDLKEVRKGVAHAWRLLQSGKHWQYLKREIKLVGTVRALEVTHGEHGWHPHLHVLLLVPEMKPAQVTALRARLSARWTSAVDRALGRAHVPIDHLGTNLVPAHKADYITKLGLEISDVGNKAGRKGNRTPWEIAADYGVEDLPRDAALWKHYAHSMRGARMLTWSRGLRKAAGLGKEATDIEIVRQEEALAAVAVLVIPAKVWDYIRNGAVWNLLWAAEQGDNALILRELETLVERERQRRQRLAQAPP